eukprot:1553574-Pleurochrysis_carterae.AAC.1
MQTAAAVKVAPVVLARVGAMEAGAGTPLAHNTQMVEHARLYRDRHLTDFNNDHHHHHHHDHSFRSDRCTVCAESATTTACTTTAAASSA